MKKTLVILLVVGLFSTYTFPSRSLAKEYKSIGLTDKEVVEYGERQGFVRNRYRNKGYKDVLDRSSSSYKTKNKNGRKYYYYEDTYYDRNDRKHYYYEEYYVDSQGDRQYYVEDYYKNSYGDKIYVLKENFNQRNYRDRRRGYYFGDDDYDYRRGRGFYEDSQYENISSMDYFDNFRNIQRRNSGDTKNRDYGYLRFLPGKFPPGSSGWPKEKDLSTNKKEISKKLAESIRDANDSKRGPNYSISATRSLMKKYFKNKYSSDDKINLERFVYYFGFTDDYIKIYGSDYSTSTIDRYIDSLALDLYDIYYDLYRGKITETEINEIYDGTKTKDLEKESTKTIQGEEAKILNERRANLTGKAIDKSINDFYPYKITMTAGSNTLNRFHYDKAKDSIDMGVSPFVKGTKLFVPVAIVGENLGIKIEFNPYESSITLSNDAVTVKNFIGSNILLLEGKEYDMGGKSYIQNSRTMMPVDIFTNFGYEDKTDLVLSYPGPIITINNY